MRAVQIEKQEQGTRLVLGESPEPSAGPGELLIDVVGSAVNRADLMQAKGLYPPPPGAPDILGLECAGSVAEVGDGVTSFRKGDRVMALLAGGGYAERVAVDAGSAMEIPERLSFEQAAGTPEVFLTCHLNLFMLAGVKQGDAVLVQGGGSGIGTAAIQLLKEAGAKCIVTAGTREKCDRCLALGADVAINYREEDFAARALEETNQKGVDVILDCVGGPYLESHLRCLAIGGKLVLIGLMGGATAQISLGTLMMKRLTLYGSTLRARPVEEKSRIVASFTERFAGALREGRIEPIIECVMPLKDAQAAHDLVQSSAHFGKVILRVDA